jgi:Fur family iron response transcriptional regulator
MAATKEPESLTPLRGRLRACGVHPTAQRMRIAELLLATKQHLTAEQLLASLRARGDRVSKATLYNTLRLFEERGLISALAVDGARACFDSNTEPHFHFLDVATGTLSDLDRDAVEFGRLPPPPPGMEYARIDVVIRLRKRSA